MYSAPFWSTIDNINFFVDDAFTDDANVNVHMKVSDAAMLSSHLSEQFS